MSARVHLIARQLRAARIVAGHTQQHVARRVEVTQSTVSDWENGVIDPPLTTAAGIDAGNTAWGGTDG